MALKPQPIDYKQRLTAPNFSSQSPTSSALSDPIEPTQMVLTLDQLRPYNRNPRKKKNPKYEEIKASIKARGLDSPPQVTRRPGDENFIISNGGNTRLQILNELWKETGDESFYRHTCLFKPWKSEINALTGHMAENDLRGNLIWIERCLGVAECKAEYEAEGDGKPVSQSELARRLAADGYTVDRSHISRMEQTIQFLFPCIPNILWNGMGRDSADKLLALRSTAASAWEKLTNEKGQPETGIDFSHLFHEALQHFDEEPDSYDLKHAKDELIGRMTDALRSRGVNYELVLFEIELVQNPAGKLNAAALPPLPTTAPPMVDPGTSTGTGDEQPGGQPGAGGNSTATPPRVRTPAPGSQSPATPPAQQPPQLEPGTGQQPDAEPGNQVESIPVTVGGLSRVSDIWMVYPQQDSVEALRNLIDLLALEIAVWADLVDCMRSTQESGIGFTLRRPESFASQEAAAAWDLLACLSGNHDVAIDPMNMQQLLTQQLPDELLIKYFRMIRLTRRLQELDGGMEP